MVSPISGHTVITTNRQAPTMTRASFVLVLAATLGVSACAVAPPTGPSVTALPPQGKSFETFQEEDYVCRVYAGQVSGGVAPAQAAGQSAVGSAVIGTLAGAGLGAALGSLSGQLGAGAAVGSAAGLLMGSAMGASNARVSGAEAQHRYDSGYTQCMYSKGNAIQQAPTYVAAPAYPYAYYQPPSASIVVGGGWGGPRYYPGPRHYAPWPYRHW
jgi:hypothetical protein